MSLLLLLINWMHPLLNKSINFFPIINCLNGNAHIFPLDVLFSKSNDLLMAVLNDTFVTWESPSVKHLPRLWSGCVYLSHAAAATSGEVCWVMKGFGGAAGVWYGLYSGRYLCLRVCGQRWCSSTSIGASAAMAIYPSASALCTHLSASAFLSSRDCALYPAELFFSPQPDPVRFQITAFWTFWLVEYCISTFFFFFFADLWHIYIFCVCVCF